MTPDLCARLFYILVITAAIYDYIAEGKSSRKRKLSEEAKVISLEENSFHHNRTWLMNSSTLQKQVLQGVNPDGLDRKKRKAEIVAEVQRVQCQPRPTIVPLPKPPHGYTYIPHCVILNRCSGCCNNDLYECVSVKKKTTRKAVFKDKRGATKGHFVRVEEDEKCICECKQVKRKDCSPQQTYDENSCACVCPNAMDSDNCGTLKVWDAEQCKCICRNSTCSKGNNPRSVNEETCRCERSSRLKLRRNFPLTPDQNDVLYK